MTFFICPEGLMYWYREQTLQAMTLPPMPLPWDIEAGQEGVEVESLHWVNASPQKRITRIGKLLFFKFPSASR